MLENRHGQGIDMERKCMEHARTLADEMVRGNRDHVLNELVETCEHKPELGMMLALALVTMYGSGVSSLMSHLNQRL